MFVILHDGIRRTTARLSICQEVSGVEHDYRITEKAVHVFRLEQEGLLIAELTNDNRWLRLSGKPLDKELFQRICNRIQQHYA
jgi:hypothetical protein